MQNDLALDERVLRMDICKREHAGDTGSRSGGATGPCKARHGRGQGQGFDEGAPAKPAGVVGAHEGSTLSRA